MPRRTTIGSLKHRIAICSQKDVVIDGDSMRLVREDVYHAWADIDFKLGSQFSVAGYAVEEPRNRQTHEIMMRFRRDIDITSMAWVYEERTQSGSRWFKILRVKEHDGNSRFIKLVCRLVERGGALAPPVAEGNGELIKTVKSTAS